MMQIQTLDHEALSDESSHKMSHILPRTDRDEFGIVVDGNV